MISYKETKKEDWHSWSRLSQTAREKAAQEVINAYWAVIARAFRNYQYLSIDEKINQKAKGKSLFSERIKVLGWVKNPDSFMSLVHENMLCFTENGELIWFAESLPQDAAQPAPVDNHHFKSIAGYGYNHRSRKAVKQLDNRA
jgi:hypothetical protein